MPWLVNNAIVTWNIFTVHNLVIPQWKCTRTDPPSQILVDAVAGQFGFKLMNMDQNIDFVALYIGWDFAEDVINQW